MAEEGGGQPLEGVAVRYSAGGLGHYRTSSKYPLALRAVGNGRSVFVPVLCCHLNIIPEYQDSPLTSGAIRL